MNTVRTQLLLELLCEDGAGGHGPRMHYDSPEGTKSRNRVHEEPKGQYQERCRPNTERQKEEEEQADPYQKGVDGTNNKPSRELSCILADGAAKDTVRVFCRNGGYHRPGSKCGNETQNG